jgi:hypothetical protein
VLLVVVVVVVEDDGDVDRDAHVPTLSLISMINHDS